MSKQSDANKVFNANAGMSRKTIIGLIEAQLGVSAAYASTLYATANKQGMDQSAKPTSNVKTTKENKMAITKFDRATLKALRNELDVAMKAVTEKYNISHKLGGIRFTETDFTVKVSVQVGSGADSARLTWEKYAPMFGLKASDFGKSFFHRGAKFKIVGIKPNARNNPVVAESARGARYVFTTDDVLI